MRHVPQLSQKQSLTLSIVFLLASLYFLFTAQGYRSHPDVEEHAVLLASTTYTPHSHAPRDLSGVVGEFTIPAARSSATHTFDIVLIGPKVMFSHVLAELERVRTESWLTVNLRVVYGPSIASVEQYIPTPGQQTTMKRGAVILDWTTAGQKILYRCPGARYPNIDFLALVHNLFPAHTIGAPPAQLAPHVRHRSIGIQALASALAPEHGLHERYLELPHAVDAVTITHPDPLTLHVPVYHMIHSMSTIEEDLHAGMFVYLAGTWRGWGIIPLDAMVVPIILLVAALVVCAFHFDAVAPIPRANTSLLASLVGWLVSPFILPLAVACLVVAIFVLHPIHAIFCGVALTASTIAACHCGRGGRLLLLSVVIACLALDRKLIFNRLLGISV